MATQTVTAMSGSHAEAERAVQAFASETGVGRGGAMGSGPAGQEGFLSSLEGASIPDGDRLAFAEGMRRGGTALSARVDGTQAGRLNSALAGIGGHVDVGARRTECRSEGWTRFDPAAPGCMTPEVAAGRSRRIRVS